MYTISELVAAARKLFGKSPALVEAALKFSGKSEYTLEEAAQIVENFSRREVKK